MEDRIPMSQKDLERLKVLTEVRERRLKQVVAARNLGISPRHFRRLYHRFMAEGPRGGDLKKGRSPEQS